MKKILLSALFMSAVSMTAFAGDDVQMNNVTVVGAGISSCGFVYSYEYFKA